jgi:hypothetical protein
MEHADALVADVLRIGAALERQGAAFGAPGGVPQAIAA